MLYFFQEKLRNDLILHTIFNNFLVSAKFLAKIPAIKLPEPSTL